MHTDCHKSYPVIEKMLPDVKHQTVNHSQHLKDRDSRSQFRLPSVQQGQVYYLDLVVWRMNIRLGARREGERAQYLLEFLRILRQWHKEPLEDFDPRCVVVSQCEVPLDEGDDEAPVSECSSTDEETSDWEPEEVAPDIVEVTPKSEVEVQSERRRTCWSCHPKERWQSTTVREVRQEDLCEEGQVFCVV